ncbi:MAG: superoxide dismutase family protein [Betaproteobacteria bacterium]
MRRFILAVAATALGAALVSAQTPGARADLKDAQGRSIGHATLTEGQHGVLLHVELTGAPGGDHAFHVHAVGKCDPPDFVSAGGHFNPASRQHGFMNPRGRHAGDLPNIRVPDDGRLTFDLFVDDVTLGSGAGSLFDADGSALVMHSGKDDYTSDPAGNAGSRVACGVITRG